MVLVITSNPIPEACLLSTENTNQCDSVSRGEAQERVRVAHPDLVRCNPLQKHKEKRVDLREVIMYLRRT